MTIYREDKEYELTAKEMCKAYYEYARLLRGEDVYIIIDEFLREMGMEISDESYKELFNKTLDAYEDVLENKEDDTWRYDIEGCLNKALENVSLETK